MAAACHSRWALRDVDGEALRAPRPSGGNAFLDPEWQASHPSAGGDAGARRDADAAGSVSGLVALVQAWPGSDDRPEAK